MSFLGDGQRSLTKKWTVEKRPKETLEERLAFLGLHQCLETGITRYVGKFYQGYHMTQGKSGSLLGTPSHYGKNLRMDSNMNSRTILLAFKRNTPGQASCKPGGEEKENKPYHVSQPQAEKQPQERVESHSTRGNHA